MEKRQRIFLAVFSSRKLHWQAIDDHRVPLAGGTAAPVGDVKGASASSTAAGVPMAGRGCIQPATVVVGAILLQACQWPFLAALSARGSFKIPDPHGSANTFSRDNRAHAALIRYRFRTPEKPWNIFGAIACTSNAP